MVRGKVAEVWKSGLSLSKKTRQLLFVLVEFVFLVSLMLGATSMIFFDAAILHNGLSEKSITQYTQSFLILLSTVIFWWGAIRYPFKRGYLTVVSTLFGVMLIREADAMFDLVWHGFWVVPAICAMIVGGWYTGRNLDTLIDPFLCHFQSRYSTFVYTGLLILVVFSRLFGTGSFWEPVMGSDYSPSYKSVIQEGVELLGYILIFYGSSMSLMDRFGDQETIQSRIRN